MSLAEVNNVRKTMHWRNSALRNHKHRNSIKGDGVEGLILNWAMYEVEAEIRLR